MPFDPDAFLATEGVAVQEGPQSFDPDTFLADEGIGGGAGFDPDAFLTQEGIEQEAVRTAPGRQISTPRDLSQSVATARAEGVLPQRRPEPQKVTSTVGPDGVPRVNLTPDSPGITPVAQPMRESERQHLREQGVLDILHRDKTPIEPRGSKLFEEALFDDQTELGRLGSNIMEGALVQAPADLLGLFGRVTAPFDATRQESLDFLMSGTEERAKRQAELNLESKFPRLQQAGLGVSRSLTQMIGATALAGPMGFTEAALAPILTAAGVEGNQAIKAGMDAGLEGQDLWEHVLSQTVIEGAPATFMQAMGLGGMESLAANLVKGSSREGVKAALKKATLDTFVELPEELVTEVSHAVEDHRSGVNPDALSPENLREVIISTTLQTFGQGATMGLATVGQAATADPDAAAKVALRRRVDLGIRISANDAARESRASEVQKALGVTEPEALKVEVESTITREELDRLRAERVVPAAKTTPVQTQEDAEVEAEEAVETAEETVEEFVEEPPPEAEAVEQAAEEIDEEAVSFIEQQVAMVLDNESELEEEALDDTELDNIVAENGLDEIGIDAADLRSAMESEGTIAGLLGLAPETALKPVAFADRLLEEQFPTEEQIVEQEVGPVAQVEADTAEWIDAVAEESKAEAAAIEQDLQDEAEAKQATETEEALTQPKPVAQNIAEAPKPEQAALDIPAQSRKLEASNKTKTGAGTSMAPMTITFSEKAPDEGATSFTLDIATPLKKVNTYDIEYTYTDIDTGDRVTHQVSTALTLNEAKEVGRAYMDRVLDIDEGGKPVIAPVGQKVQRLRLEAPEQKAPVERIEDEGKKEFRRRVQGGLSLAEGQTQEDLGGPIPPRFLASRGQGRTIDQFTEDAVELGLVQPDASLEEVASLLRGPSFTEVPLPTKEELEEFEAAQEFREQEDLTGLSSESKAVVEIYGTRANAITRVEAQTSAMRAQAQRGGDEAAQKAHTASQELLADLKRSTKNETASLFPWEVEEAQQEPEHHEDGELLFTERSGYEETDIHGENERPPESKRRPKKAREIIDQLSKLFNVPIRVGKLGRRPKTIQGFFRPRTRVARIRNANDVSVALHETGHAFEDMFRRTVGISRDTWSKKMPKPVQEELKDLDYDQGKRRAYEGFAEFFEKYMRHPERAKDQHPASYKWFEQTMLTPNKKLTKQLRKVQDEIITFENQGPFAQAEAQLEMPEHDTTVQRTRDLLHRAKNWPHYLLTLFADQQRIIDTFMRQVPLAEDEVIRPSQDPAQIMRAITMKASPKASNWLANGPTDFAGNTVGASIADALSLVEGDERGAMVYAFALHGQEVWARGMNPGISRRVADFVVEHHGSESRVRFAKALNDYSVHLVDYLQDAGALSEEDATRILGTYNFYIPLKRVFDESDLRVARGGETARQVGEQPKVIKAQKGSGRSVVDPIESLIRYTEQVVSVADKTRLARLIANIADNHEGMGQWVEEVPADIMVKQFKLETIFEQLLQAGIELPEDAELDTILTLYSNSSSTPMPGNVVSFVVNGQRRFFELHPELFRALQSVDYQRIPKWVDLFLGVPARGLRLGATGVRAGFTLLTNPFRDTWHGFLVGDYGFAETSWRLGNAYASVLASTVTGGKHKSEAQALWEATGGPMTTFLGIDQNTMRKTRRSLMRNSATRRAYNIVQNPLDAVDALREVLSFSESARRIAEFDATIRDMGWRPGEQLTEDQAILGANRAAEVSVNFTRSGSLGRQLNQITAFHNAAIQGLFRFGRAMKEHPVRSTVRGLTLITAPAVMSWMMYKDDEEWKDKPAWLKYGFLNLKVGGEWLRVPVPFDWWYAFGALPIAHLEMMYNEDPDAINKAMGEAWDTLHPPVIPSGALAIHETAADFSHFRDQTIVPFDRQGLAPELQFNKWTTETSKEVGRILGVSPARLEHLADGFSGGLASDLVSASENMLGIGDASAAFEPSGYPVFGRLFVRDSTSEAMTEFYDEREMLRSMKASFDTLEDIDPWRAEKFRIDENKLKAFEEAGGRISKLRKQYNESPLREERRTFLDEMKGIAKDVLEQTAFDEPKPKKGSTRFEYNLGGL